MTFREHHAENVGDNNDQSGYRADKSSARDCFTSSQVIEFTRSLGDTMIGRVTSKMSPHTKIFTGILSPWINEYLIYHNIHYAHFA